MRTYKYNKSKKPNRTIKKRKYKGGDDSQTEPMVATEEPLVATEEPMVATEEPMVATEEPMVATEEPLVATEEPMVATEEPMVATEEPMVATEEPMVATEEPMVATEEPMVATEEPMVATEEPMVATEEPMVSDQQSNDKINITLNKKTLQTLSLNLNKNIIMNISAYITVINKLIETELDEQHKTKLINNRNMLVQIANLTSDLFDNIQLSYGIENPEKSEEIKKIIDETESSSLIKGLLTGEMAVMASAFATAAILLGGKKTRRKRNKKHSNKKKTRRYK
jgi:hypothetical protein